MQTSFASIYSDFLEAVEDSVRALTDLKNNEEQMEMRLKALRRDLLRALQREELLRNENERLRRQLPSRGAPADRGDTITLEDAEPAEAERSA